MLYFPESTPRRRSKTPRRTAPRKVGISRFSSHSLMIPRLKSDDMEGGIRELASRMEDEKFVDDSEKLVEFALRREAIVTTAVEHGLAFPHVRGVEGGGLTFAMGVHQKGIKFDPAPKGLSHIIFFIVIPAVASAFYLKLLSGLTETFLKTENRKAVMEETDPDKLWKTMTKLTRSTIK
jgi:mannitol/fructose-specific phosphotransferase system IIA component (Ntr-type)